MQLQGLEYFGHWNSRERLLDIKRYTHPKFLDWRTNPQCFICVYLCASVANRLPEIPFTHGKNDLGHNDKDFYRHRCTQINTDKERTRMNLDVALVNGITEKTIGCSFKVLNTWVRDFSKR